MSIKHVTFTNVTLAVALLAAPFAVNAQTVRYRVVPLAEIASASTSCVPTAINAPGDSVGYCAAGELASFAVLWRDGAVINLGRLPDGVFSHAYAINSAGELVGDGDDGDLRGKALAYRNGGWMQIDGSGGSYQNAYGIADNGVIFGNYSSTSSPATETWQPVYWTYDADHDRYDRRDLPRATGTPTTGFSGAFVFGASSAGLAVGQLATDILGNRAAFWNNDPSHSLVVLANPDGTSAGLAFAVSDDGRAAGYAYGAAAPDRAVLWLNDAARTPVDLGTLPGDVRSRAFGVNITGQVVGASYGLPAIARGFIYQNGALSSLTALLDSDDSAWTIDEPAGINNAGQIIATGTLNGVRHPVMLVPFNPGPIDSLNIAADLVSPQLTGTTIAFSAAAAGGVSPYEFKWFVRDGAGETMAQDWGTSPSFRWTPAAAGRYDITVWARSAGNAEDAAEQTATMPFDLFSLITSVAISADLASPQVAGTTVSFAAAAAGGVAPYQFKWLLTAGGASNVVQDWSETASFAWTPAAAGDYEIAVWARSAGNADDTAEQSATFPFAITRRLVSALTLTSALAPPQVAGTTITFNAAASGGTEPYEFKWLIDDGSATSVLQDWSAAATLSWTPTTANANYAITVWVRGAGNAEDTAEQVRSMPFAISSSVVTSLALTANLPAPQPARTAITLTATPSGGTAPFQFKWLINDGVSTIVALNWNSSSTIVWTPKKANANYVITVWVRSAGNTADTFEQAASLAYPISSRGKGRGHR